MELVTKKKLHLVSGRANRPLAEEIADCLGVELGEVNIEDFSNGEIHCRFGESVRGMDVFIIQSHGASGHMSINDAIWEHLEMVDAAKRASAKRITAVMPYYGYGRQDRKSEPRVPITARLVANLLASSGVTRVLTMDLHAGQIQGFFDIPVDHLYGMPVLLSYFQEKKLSDVVVV